MKKISLTVLLSLGMILGVNAQKYDYFGAERAEERWTLGLHGGTGMILGDVAGKPAYQAGIHVEKVVNPWFSLRFTGTYGQFSGQDLSPTTDIRNNSALNGSRDSIITPYLSFDTVNTRVFMNYQMKSTDIGLQGKVNLIHLFSKSYTGGFDLYAVGGIGYQFYRTQMDMAQGNAQYDFNQITATDNAGITTQLANLQDGVFETVADNGKQMGLLGYRNFALKGGAGIRQRLGNHLAIGLEAQYLFVQDDQLDGKEFPIPVVDPTTLNSSYKASDADGVGTASVFVQFIF
jgi:hypothetical protein